eukprot:gnl/MRDRNA2_/MRDRNA2_106328_c0_seq1.p1 gnl/MRDRNA2_/MRDRNA2_106328_c0~~gnl/MRDRNA2_/MRDRNA2_106328_c0_seq1.p1  ORF type:complete len:358 (-),score=59.57 gnl/MRDRNA2_/MRDRNA2_106328_c0_seq1:13-1017(-)
MSDLKKYYEYLDIQQPFEYVEGLIDRVTGQVPTVRMDESLLEIIVVDAGLFKSFDPLSPYQAPFIEIVIEGPEGRQLIETSTCHPQSEEPTYEEEEKASFNPTWNERFIFRAAGGTYVRFDLCIEHLVRNRTICGHCAFSAEDLWSRAKDGRQIMTVPLVHNQGGGWEREEELVGALRLVVGLMDMATVQKLPKLDKHLCRIHPEHRHHFGHKGGKPKKSTPEKEKIEAKLEMPTLQYVRQHIPPQIQPVQYVGVPRSPAPMQSMQSMSMVPAQVPMQSMTASRPTLSEGYSVPSPAPVPVTTVPNLVPASLAPISYASQSGLATVNIDSRVGL